jgi:hypothetical protein
MMTVAELIAELQKLPGHAPVLIEDGGSEGGMIFDADIDALTWEGTHALILVSD